MITGVSLYASVFIDPRHEDEEDNTKQPVYYQLAPIALVTKSEPVFQGALDGQLVVKQLKSGLVR